MAAQVPSSEALSPSESRKSTQRSMLPLVLLVVALLLALVVALAFAGSGELQEYAAGTHQATVQKYLEAVFDDDPDAATLYLSDAVTDRCQTALRRSFAPSGVSATLKSDRINGDSATVVIRLTFASDSVFDAGRYSEEARFYLERLDGQWRIVDDPWPVAPCGM